MSVKVVNSGSGVINITAETIPTIKVSSPTVSVVDINPVVTGSTIGPTGAQGPAGSDGQGLEAGGDKHQVLKKTDDVDYNTEWGFADRVFISVKFDEAVSAGDPVYVSGYQPGEDVVKVSKADSSDSTKMPAIGLAIEDYSSNEFGSVACIGSLYGIDTDDFDVGDVLYVKSGGGLTKDKPTGATNLIQNVGKVGRSQQNNGEIVVMAIGRSNDVPNIADGKVWIGNGSGVATPTTLNAAAIPDFDTEVSNNSSVVANTAKETNVTTNLGLTRSSVNVTVTSSDGENTTIPPASTDYAGVMTAAEHSKLANLNASADVTNSSSVEAAGAIMDTDFTSNGLMERTGNGSYTTVPKSTSSIPEGTNLYYTDARADARIAAASVADLNDGGDVILTTTTDVSGTNFVLNENTLVTNSSTKVPTQASVKAYVDSQLSPAIQMDSGSPVYNSQTNEAEIRTLLNLENSDIRNLVSASTSGSGSLSYDSGNGVFTYTGPNLSTYVQQSDLSATGSVSGISLSENNGAFTLGGSLDTIPVSGGGTGATTVAGAKQNLELEDSDIRNKFSAGANISISSEGVIATTGVLTEESNDLSASVTWANVPDAFITSSSVTQHLSTTGAGVGGINISESNGVFSLTGSLDITADAAPVLGGDLDVGGNTITSSSNGDVEIHPHGTGDVIIDGQGVDIRYSGGTKLDVTSGGIEVTGNIELQDDGKIRMGASNDFILYHDGTGTNNFIDSSAQTLVAKYKNSFYLQDGVNNETSIQATANAGVDLYYNNVAKLNTTASGIKVVGSINVNDAFTIPSSDGAANQVLQTNGSGTLSWVTLPAADTIQTLTLGTPTSETIDLSISGSGGNSVTIPKSTTTAAGLMTAAQFNKLNNIDANATNYSDDEVDAHLSGGTGISYSNGVISVNGATTFSTADSGDDVKAVITGPNNGTSDLIFEGGNNVTVAQSNGTITIAATTNVTGLSAVVEDTTPSLGGDLNVNGNSLISPTNGDILVNPNGTGKFRVEHDSEVAIRSTKDAGVELFHNNTKKFETLSTGINVAGDANIGGYVNPTGSNSGVRINAGQILGAAGLHSGAEILDSFFGSASLVAGKLYYAGPSAWALADKDAESTASGLLGIATDSANANEMVVKGVVRVATLSGSSPAKGDIVYVGDDGNPTTDAPSSDGDIVRIIGYVVTAGQSRTIYFNPSPDFIEIA